MSITSLAKGKHVYRVLIIAGIAAALYITKEQSSFFTNRNFRNIWMAFERGGVTYIVNGVGTRRRIYADSKIARYWSPRIGPNMEIVAHRDLYTEKEPSTPVISEVVIVNSRLQEESTLSRDTTNNSSDFIFSPTGTKLAYFQEKDVVIFDLQKNRELFRTSRANTFASSSNSNITAWLSEDQLAILGAAKDLQNEAIYRLDLRNRSLELLCTGEIHSKFYEGVLSKQYREHPEQSVSCIHIPEWDALFGSKEWPVSHLIATTDPHNERFYFYLRSKDSGFFYPGKKWIEGYDRVRQKTFFVATVESVWDRLMR